MKGRGLFFVLVLFSQVSMAIDLALTIDDNPTDFEPGSTQTNTYDVTISKPNSTAAVTGIEVTLTFSGSTSPIDSMNWSCAATGTSSCDTSSGTVTSNAFTVGLDLSADDGDDVTITITQVSYNATNFSDLNFAAEITDDGDTNDTNSNNDSANATISRASVTDLTTSLTNGQPATALATMWFIPMWFQILAPVMHKMSVSVMAHRLLV